MPKEDRGVRAQPDIDHALLESFLGSLRERLSLSSLVVFGSRATGENLEESDYDILVLSPDFEKYNRFERIELLLDAWPGLLPLEPLAMTPEEFAAAEGALVWDVLEEGVVVLDDGTFEGKRRRHLQRVKSGELRKEGDFWVFT
ncbi:nucleotidyltransferase domain-containing protein [Candidatus Solincola tengchongensis]|uniref:nucleotidyltransferase domain-containing protein n=1 Tax=Candidatus Solincola tengchongensis TaxID=2900693 RepID=UPI00257A0BA7|nr:nucleotidyltransferase domain-containing protein [Candidatus Solincola tengchongensis]